MNDLHHCGRKLTHCLLLLLVVLGLTSQVLVATSWAPSATSTTAKSPHYDNPSTKKNSEGDHKGLVTNSSLLYECKLSYLQLDMSLIKFSINYLEHDDSDDHDDGTLDEEAQDLQVVGDFKLVAIDFNTTTDELRSNTKLNASLPFVFFINGFNTFGPDEEFNNTWMYDVARSFAKRSSGRGPSSFDEENDKQDGMYQQAPSPLGRNVVFLTWSIPDLFASNLFSLIPAYYKTVANYDLIMAHVTQTLLKLIEFVDEGNSVLFSRFKEVRARHFRKFHFYGHSLGSHILSDAILQVVSGRGPPVTPSSSSSASIRRDKNKALKFGKLVGLDPATPCFVSLAYGISSTKVSEAVNEVIVLHSNAGFAGVPNERTQLEIVLNGGTFQPGCSWWDFTCHHVRSTDILSYIDDSCQMVAYKCTSYHHFKRGACETCLNSDPLTSAKPSLNCLLVNLPEQHWDGRQVLTFAERFSNRTRQLAAALPFERDGLFKGNSDAILKPIELFRRLEELQLREELKVRQLLKNGSTSDGVVNQELEVNNNNEPKNQKKAFYHYVNTSPNFRFGRKSHCLQHYQLRLLIYHEDLSLKDKCKTSSFYIKSSSDVKLRLFYETATKKLPHKHRTRSRASDSLRFQARDSLEPKLVQDSQDPRVMSSKIKLNAIIKDVFYTALVNFEHEPKLFVGAHLDNLDLARMAECFRRENATSGPNFVLDIAFMSHTNQKIRHAFSSVLCSQLELNGKNNVKIESEDQDQTRYETDQPELLVLKLCKQSQLKNVSSQIDKLLNRIKLQRLEETWKVSLLNSLFSLFIEWEPF